jgi:hypothetical protein
MEAITMEEHPFIIIIVIKAKLIQVFVIMVRVTQAFITITIITKHVNAMPK